MPGGWEERKRHMSPKGQHRPKGHTPGRSWGRCIAEGGQEERAKASVKGEEGKGGTGAQQDSAAQEGVYPMQVLGARHRVHKSI